MHFSIRQVRENDLSLVNIRDEKTGTEISLLPAHGATLHAFRVSLRERDRARQPEASNGYFNVIDGYKDLEEVEREMGRSFKGPKLSPFPCRIDGGKYQFEGKEFAFGKLFSDGNAIHG